MNTFVKFIIDHLDNGPFGGPGWYDIDKENNVIHLTMMDGDHMINATYDRNSNHIINIIGTPHPIPSIHLNDEEKKALDLVFIKRVLRNLPNKL